MGDMCIPHQFASLYDGQKVFLWFDCPLDLGIKFLVTVDTKVEVLSAETQQVKGSPKPVVGQS